jgi:hypothetical protein
LTLKKAAKRPKSLAGGKREARSPRNDRRR